MSGGGGGGSGGGSVPFALAGGIMSNAEFMQRLEHRLSMIENAIAVTNTSMNALTEVFREADLSPEAIEQANGVVEEWKRRIEKEGW